MDVDSHRIQIAWAICILLVTGCGDLDLTSYRDLGNGQSVRPPLAVISFEPTQQFLANAQSALGHLPIDLDGEQLQSLLPAIDSQRLAAVILFDSERGVTETLIYMPVQDYEVFLNELGQLVRLKRAIASSFHYRGRRLLVKQVGDYAAIGMSLKGIKQGPRPPRLKQLAPGFDLELELFPQSIDEREGMRLARFLKNCLGKQLAEMVAGSESLTCGLKFNSDELVEFQAQVQPAPSNIGEIRQSVNDLITNGGNALAQVEDEILQIELTVPGEQARLAWSYLQPAALAAFESRLVVLAKSASDTWKSRGDDGTIPLPSFSTGCSEGGGTVRRG